MMSVPVRIAARVAVATLLLAAPSRSTLTAQGTTPADVAAKMTGRWKLNESLSPAPSEPSSGSTIVYPAGRVGVDRFSVPVPVFVTTNVRVSCCA